MVLLASTQAVVVSGFGVVAACALAAWGGVMIGAPEKAFWIEHPLLVEAVDLTFYGAVAFWTTGAATILGAAIGAGVVVSSRLGTGVALLAALVALAVGVASVRKAREFSESSHEVFDHY